MNITLPQDLAAYLEEEARTRGYGDPSAFVRALLERERERGGEATGDPIPEDLKGTPGWAAVEHLTGTATRGLSAEQITTMTRSET